MIDILADNIVSPLGMDTEQNWRAVLAGESALRYLEGWHDLPQGIMAGVFSDEQNEKLLLGAYNRFESMAIRSIGMALEKSGIDPTGERVLFVLSTTKGDIEELGRDSSKDRNYHGLASSAARIAGHFGISTSPIVSCNACISGVSAQLMAGRLMEAGLYDYAIVCGADCVSPFVAAGFLSFKSMSPQQCRPFDIDRLGLNLGEAAATLVLARHSASHKGWSLMCGFMDNDAYHLSAPSPTGEGALKVLKQVLECADMEDVAFVNAHGTATMFNDQMESLAIQKAGLSDMPLTALKCHYGHTLGASGVLEVILSMKAVEEGVVLPVPSYAERGVSGKVNVSSSLRQGKGHSFIKMISGFGGCNAAALYTAGVKDCVSDTLTLPEGKVMCSLRLDDKGLDIDGSVLETESSGKALLTEIYKKYIGDYPKFYKMDMLGKLVFLASELLLRRERELGAASGLASDSQDYSRAVILFNRSASILSDRAHVVTMDKPDSFYPSPSTFLYTMPNIVAGDIAIRHGYKGETSLNIMEVRDDKLITQVTASTLAFYDSVLCAWVDCSAEDCFEAEFKIITK